MAPSRCAHQLSSNKKAKRIQNLVTFTKTASKIQLTTKLVEIWATPQCSITDARILLTLGADPEALYKDDYGEKTLRDREDSGSVCSECAEKYRDFLEYAQEIYHSQHLEQKGDKPYPPVTSAESANTPRADENRFANGRSPGNSPRHLAYNGTENKNGSVKHDNNTGTLNGDGKVCLSLDGGGMRGLVSIVCLLFTSRRTLGDESLVSLVDWFVGCSTGAILALALAKGYTLTETFFLYWEMKNEIFLDSNTMKRLFGNVVDKQTMRIEAVLNRVFAETDTFGNSSKRLTVPALNVIMSPSKLHTFRNYPIKGSHWDKEVTLRDAARASSAAPTYFHPHSLADAKYVDGSLAANCPLSVLFREYDKCRQSGENLRLGCVISIGTGEPNSTLRRYQSGTSFSHRSRHLREMTTLLMEQVVGQEKSAIECAQDRCAVSGIPFFRLSPVGVDVRIDQIDDGKLMDMIWVTFKHLLENIEYVDKLGAMLIRIRDAKLERKMFSCTRQRSQTIL
ncbi:patatin-like phospholipase domain-containing protein [Ditylenchus destructor]|nr:patatin-like phospholipase domain-containing protein [Ditylenchus destructor]